MAQGPNNNDAFLGSAMQFMQAGQNITQQFMEFMGKSGSQVCHSASCSGSAGAECPSEELHGSANVALAGNAGQTAGTGTRF